MNSKSLSLLFAAVLSCAGASHAQTKLRAWNIHPDGYPVTEAMKSFAEEVGKASKGKYQIEVFSNATLGDQPKAVQMLKVGESILPNSALARCLMRCLASRC